METFVGIVFIVVCLLLIMVVLLQKGRGGGLGAAFGGAGSSAFGTRTGDVFTWITIVLTALFLLLAIGATFVYRPTASKVLKPTFAPAEGPIYETTSVTIDCGTSNAKIAYTTDGKEPTEDRAKLSGMVDVSVEPGQTLKARAFRKKWDPSDLAEMTYAGKVLKPALNPADGPISMTTSVQITCGTPKAAIAYTTNGSDPVAADAKPGKVTASVQPGQTLKVRAFFDKWDPSDLVTVTYDKPATTKPATSPATKPGAPPAGGDKNKDKDKSAGGE